jgi:hypothetical protein
MVVIFGNESGVLIFEIENGNDVCPWSLTGVIEIDRFVRFCEATAAR